MTTPDDRSYIPVNRAGEVSSPPELTDNPPMPSVLGWYKAYCGAMVLMYGLVIVLGLFMLIAPALLKDFSSSTGKGGESVDLAVNMVMGGVYVAIGLVFALVYLIGAFIPARPWGWVVGIVLIALSFTSCCCIPISIPLLIYWFKTETKAFFHSS